MSTKDQAGRCNTVKTKTIEETALLESLKVVVDLIARTFGSRCEVSIQDLRHLEHSIVKIANGHVTGRDVGDTASEQGIKYLHNGSDTDFYESMVLSDSGKYIKSTAAGFRDSKGQPIMGLVINFDVTDILNYNVAIQDIFDLPRDNSKNKTIDSFDGNGISTMTHMAENTIRKSGKAIPTMGKRDKLGIVKQLENQGFFLFKGAVKFLARRLNVSQSTLYVYLERVRSKQSSTSDLA